MVGTKMLNQQTLKRGLLITLTSLGLFGCQTTERYEVSLQNPIHEKNEKLVSYLSQPTCIEDSEFHRSKVASMSSKKYHLSAKILERCLTDIKNSNGKNNQETLLQYQMVVLLDLIKAGRIKEAEQKMVNLQEKWPDHDLYTENGYSVFNTLSLILFGQSMSNNQKYDNSNVNSAIRSEFSRLRYWQNN